MKTFTTKYLGTAATLSALDEIQRLAGPLAQVSIVAWAIRIRVAKLDVGAAETGIERLGDFRTSTAVTGRAVETAISALKSWLDWRINGRWERCKLCEEYDQPEPLDADGVCTSCREARAKAREYRDA